MKELKESIDKNTEPNSSMSSHIVTPSVEKQDYPFRGSLIFSIQDGLGALKRILSVLADMSINMTRIESRPSNTDKWDYDFFVDFLAKDSLSVERIEDNLKRMDLVKNTKLLGLTKSDMSKKKPVR